MLEEESVNEGAISLLLLLPLLLLLFVPPLLLPWLAAFTFVEALVTSAAALSVLVLAEAEDSAAMLVLETEDDVATAVSTLETLN